MLQSQLFTKVLRSAPKGEEAASAQLLIRAGYIHKVMAGVYEMLPLGLRVMNKIIGIVREEMNAIGGVELNLTALQSKDIWDKTRWDDKVLDVWFKTNLKDKSEIGLATTHEEPLTALMKNYISSYRDLPIYVYQFQTKFRNELRAKSGLLRGREFLMKDLYSFSLDQASHEEFYEKSKQAYHKIFERVGLGDITYLTFASGGTFSKYSHEFQTITDVGEDTVYLDKKKKIAVNKEVYNDEVLENLGLKKSEMEEVKAVEVGNIFPLGFKYSEPFDLTYKDETGKEVQVYMGSYGIGIGRLMGTIAEVFHDDKGLMWPDSVAPFQIHLINIAKDQKEADKIYKALLSDKFEVLYDQREMSPGAKFADSDIIGIPVRVLVSDKTLAQESVEIKMRNSDKSSIVKMKDLAESLKKSK
jgi:prolyl-tRNA synthetase